MEHTQIAHAYIVGFANFFKIEVNFALNFVLKFSAQIWMDSSKNLGKFLKDYKTKL